MLILLFSIDSSACYKCLEQNNNLEIYTHFWCVTDGTCKSVSDIESCSSYEMHDMLYDANVCCVDIATEDSCLSGNTISYCLWCPTHLVDSVSITGKCMYSGPQGPELNYDNVNKNCLTAPDISSKCSQLNDCPTCAENVVCAFCPVQGRCITKLLEDKPYPQSLYKCSDGMTTVCCDSYSDCETCALNTMSITSPVCVWCGGGNTDNETPYCSTADKVFGKCSTDMNALGASYCSDSCYLKGKTCTECLAQSGCIWLSNIKLNDFPNSPPIQLCAPGGSSGPKVSTIQFTTQLPQNYGFEVVTFNYLTCSLNASQLNSLIISLCIIVVLAIVIAYSATFILKKVRYNKLLKAALLAALSDEDKKMVEEEQAFDVNDYMTTVQEIPWEDEI
ncbi:Cysteine-rich membrane protein 2 [Spironucleus salmonicida]|uniref:Cysteine-rich membrane protein 2 n=1 Tax=Spironucleus salmonicida TaxID=348837 RepID=V6LPP8_9EUKA|nr:Cysteine-rich membrane protein 2 [Spironucleus salmonicida]|eukprot:EST45676.1 Cysteine-rich membrane protein 2 [Spironucleus salmonicida]